MSDQQPHCLAALARRYPQLFVPIQAGASQTELYSKLVRRGEPATRDQHLDFSLNAKDSLTMEETPAGPAEVLFLEDRDDFEHAVKALAYRCEPTDVPESMGAIALNGLTDWGKIQEHCVKWLAEGNSARGWGAELARFAKDRANVRGAIIILSSGCYSAVPSQVAGMSDSDWHDASIQIRKYHELTHFVSRRLHPENADALRDEVVADLIGLWAAFGRYDVRLALEFLGIAGEGCTEGGRLRNYLSEGDSLDAAVSKAHATVDALAAFVQDKEGEDCFELLERIESQKVALAQS